MPTERQRKQAAIRKAQRQLARRQAEAARRRRRNQVIGIAATVVVVAGIVVGIVLGTSGSDKKAAAPSSSPATSAAPTSSAPAKRSTPARPASAKATPTGSPYPTRTFAKKAHAPLVSSGPCRYTETAALMKDPTAKDVGVPPDPSPTPSTGTVKLELTTSRGPIEITLDRATAPCAVQSTEFLVKKGFYDATSCPRVVTKGIFVVQCGDPSNTQGGGPTYRFSEEINQGTAYGAGSVAMANTGAANTTGSQFFMVFKDSNQNQATGSGLSRNYSVIGRITKGLDVVTKVARGGAAATAPPASGSTATGAPTDGRPILGLTITSAGLA